MEVQLANGELEPRVQAHASGSTTIEVRLKNGRSLIVAARFDAGHLRALLAVVESMFGLPSLHTLDRARGRIWLAAEATDMRCGFDRLAERVRAVIGQDPLSGHLFVFRSRRGDRLKILLWEQDGFVLWYKRLEWECSSYHG